MKNGVNDVLEALENFLKILARANFFESLIFTYKLKDDSFSDEKLRSALEDFRSSLSDLLEESGGRFLKTTKIELDDENIIIGNKFIVEDNEADNDDNECCEICGRKFKSATGLRFHMKAKHEEAATVASPSSNKNFCHICRKKFVNERVLQYHVEKIHKDDNESSEKKKTLEEEEILDFVCCQICYKSFRLESELQSHVCLEAQLKGIQFRKVKAFDDPEVLKMHNKFQCGYCQEVYKQFKRISYHISKCRGGPFPCELCGEKFESRKRLNAHKSEEHKGQNSYFCPECPLNFKLNTSLQKHMIKRHEDDPELSLKCDKCPKKFFKSIYLTNHKIRFHNTSKKFLCQICGDRFSTPYSLTSHLEIHSEVKKYPCDICGKAFRRKDKMLFHSYTHTGVKPFKCDICKKGFIRKAKLDDHLRRHRGEKRFCCLVCNKMYSGSWDLRQHIRKAHPRISKDIKPNVALSSQIISVNIVDEKEDPSRSNNLNNLLDLSLYQASENYEEEEEEEEDQKSSLFRQQNLSPSPSSDHSEVPNNDKEDENLIPPIVAIDFANGGGLI